MIALAKKIAKGIKPVSALLPNSPDPLIPFPSISLYRAVYRWINPLSAFVSAFPFSVIPFPLSEQGDHEAGSWEPYRRRPSGGTVPSGTENPAHEVGDG